MTLKHKFFQIRKNVANETWRTRGVLLSGTQVVNWAVFQMPLKQYKRKGTDNLFFFIQGNIYFHSVCKRNIDLAGRSRLLYSFRTHILLPDRVSKGFVPLPSNVDLRNKM